MMFLSRQRRTVGVRCTTRLFGGGRHVQRGGAYFAQDFFDGNEAPSLLVHPHSGPYQSRLVGKHGASSTIPSEDEDTSMPVAITAANMGNSPVFAVVHRN